jgi:hypothetical protein
MAILAGCPGLEARILVDNEFAEEHVSWADRPKPHEVVKYVRALSGGNFGIWYSFTAPFPTDKPVAMKVIVDGQALDEPVHFDIDLKNHEGYTSLGPLFRDGEQSKLQRYHFSELKIGE